MESFYIYLLIAGIVGGFVAGMVGIGTGFLLIAVIPIALDQLSIPDTHLVKFTIANTIFATMCSSFVNNLTLIKQGKYYWKEAPWVAVGAIVSATLLLYLVVLQVNYPRDTYNILIIAFLSYVIIRSVLKLRKDMKPRESITKFKLATTGLVGGAVAAMTGLGGGSVVIPLLNIWLKIDIKKAKSITFATIFAIALILTIINLLSIPSIPISIAHHGYILFPVVIPLVVGVVVASPLGIIVSQKVSSKIISYAFIVIITLVLVRKVFELLN